MWWLRSWAPSSTSRTSGRSDRLDPDREADRPRVMHACATVPTQVSTEAAQSYASSRGLLYLETSAKDDTNVEPLFLALAAHLPSSQLQKLRSREAAIVAALEMERVRGDMRAASQSAQVRAGPPDRPAPRSSRSRAVLLTRRRAQERLRARANELRLIIDKSGHGFEVEGKAEHEVGAALGRHARGLGPADQRPAAYRAASRGAGCH